MSLTPSIYLQYYNKYYRAAAYAAGAQDVVEDNDLGNQLIFAGALTGLPLAYKAGKAAIWDIPKWTIQNFGHYGQGFRNIRTNYQAQKAATKLPDYLKGKHWWNTVANRERWDLLKDFEQKSNISAQWDTKKYNQLNAKNADLAKTYADGHNLKMDCYKEARAKIAEIKTKKLKGKELKNALKEVQKLIDKGDLKVLQEIKAGNIKPTSRLGKLFGGIKKYSGYNKYQRGVLKCATTEAKGLTGAAAKGYAKFARGGGVLTSAISLACDTPEIVETYQKLGAAKGTTQLAKSATVAVAEGAGWVIGAKVGGLIGLKAGAAIGTCIGGPVGTAIGGFVGTLIGVAGAIAGSWAAGKGAKALVGKSELQKDKESKALALAVEAERSEEGRKKLKTAVETKAKEEIEQTGQVSNERILSDYEKYLAYIDNDDSNGTDETDTDETPTETDTETQTSQQTHSKYENTLNLLASLKRQTDTSILDYNLNMRLPQSNIFNNSYNWV